jgi:hypothetical protein
MKKLKLGTYFFALFVPLASFAAPNPDFRSTREDPSVPEHCRELTPSSFSNLESQDLFFGITGALERGFTDEVRLDRKDATLLWNQLRGKDKSVLPMHLSPLMTELEEARTQMAFTYKSEGEVLEAMALRQLRERYPPSEYFTTGGYTYLNPANPGKFETVGELDVIVGRRTDCAVLRIGEAKLGLKQLGHAREQLRRFRSWLRAKLCKDSRSTATPCFQS